MSSRIQGIEQTLQNLFSDQLKFGRGIPMPEFLLKQFIYFFYQLENLYFNSNHVTRLGKFYINTHNSNNSTASKYCETLTNLRKIREPNYTPELRLTEFMISNHGFLASLIAEQPLESHQTIEISNMVPIDAYNEDWDYFKPILNLYEELNTQPIPSPIQGVLLTNSLVTLDYQKGYSDADMIVLIGDDVYQSPEKMRQVRLFLAAKARHLYLFDPLQHHGFFVFGHSVRQHYPQALFPILLYEYSANMIEGGGEVKYSFQDDSFELELLLHYSLNALLRFARMEESYFRNTRHLKSFVSQLTLFPVLLIQSKEGYIYKRDAFEQLSRFFDATDVFDLAETIRKDFPYRRLLSRWIPWVHPKLISIIHGHLLPSHHLRLVPELQKMTLELLETTVEELSRARN